MEGQDTPYPTLFSPLEVGPMRVRNRVCETTNTIGAAAMPGFVDDAFIAHHAAKARGGTAWIGSETFLLDSPLPDSAADEFMPGSGSFRVPIYLMPGFAESLQRFREALHDAGSVMVCQLTMLNFTMAASSVPLVEAYDWVPHALAEDEIRTIIGTYALAAEKFVEAGADGIEIHCAHETLPQTFLSPSMNKRSDAWNGDARARTKFLREILLAVKERVGDGGAIGIRVNGQESREGGYDLLEFREMMMYIVETGTLDFINVDVGHCWGSPSYVQPSYYGHAVYREAGKALKVDTEGEVPILFSGRVNDPGIAERLLREGCADLVGMTRAGIADPDFANKAMQGRVNEIRRCIGCNRCIGQSIVNSAPDPFKRPTCSVNPEIGNELLFAVTKKPAEVRRRLVVVGGGAAGLETARMAAERGHEVILLEKGSRLGGQLNLAARAPGRDAFDDFVIYQEEQLRMLGVDVRLATDADPELLRSLAPDAIACATGSRPRGADTPGLDAAHVVQGWDVLAGSAEVGDHVALVSQEDHFETPNVADYLAERGKRVEIFHKYKAIGEQIDRYSIGPILTRLYERDVEIHAGMRLASAADGKVGFTSVFGGRTTVREDFDSVVLVYGSVPETSLYDRLTEELRDSESAPRLFLVGSAWVPRLLAEATLHGARVGMEI